MLLYKVTCILTFILVLAASFVRVSSAPISTPSTFNLFKRQIIGNNDASSQIQTRRIRRDISVTENYANSYVESPITTDTISLNTNLDYKVATTSYTDDDFSNKTAEITEQYPWEIEIDGLNAEFNDILQEYLGLKDTNPSNVSERERLYKKMRNLQQQILNVFADLFKENANIFALKNRYHVFTEEYLKIKLFNELTLALNADPQDILWIRHISALMRDALLQILMFSEAMIRKNRNMQEVNIILIEEIMSVYKYLKTFEISPTLIRFRENEMHFYLFDYLVHEIDYGSTEYREKVMKILEWNNQ